MSVSKNLGRVRLFWRGLFNRSIQYKFLDVVSYNGSSYLVINESNIPLGTLPTDINYWSLIAEKGNKGDNGDSFEIKKTYPTIVDMQNDFSNPLLIEGNHKDENKLNNFVDNLEWVTSKQNKQYSIKSGRYDKIKETKNSLGKKHLSNTYSKFHNVSFDRNRNKWVGSIRVNNKTIMMKRFDSEIEAALHVNFIIDTLNLTDRPKNIIT